jgi:N-carbamoyl-L-amino-acid hydrolase
MPSGAGHDAMNMARIAPAGMIFIPCRGGISHNPDEYASPADIVRGMDVLTETLAALAA